jgi:serine/threonine protein kinase
MTNLFKGIAYMHSREIMHRDLKLENILLPNPNSFDVMIADFGLSTAFN